MIVDDFHSGPVSRILSLREVESEAQVQPRRSVAVPALLLASMTRASTE
jgi:hypothetical protein